ncbi:MAG: FtsW/RodA/SpoVE family cell cycle protein, partial [Patescibacteria group bacterium]
FSLWWFVGGSLVCLGLVPVFWKFLHGYQKDRVLAFFNPAIDPLGTSYNALQSIIAVGSGMFLGKGMSERTQSALSFLPEHHTDFIFATISEGLGFVGSLGIIVVFGFLLYRIYAISAEADDVFCKLYASAVFGFIFIQFFINVGMNIGIVPVVGITLPFVSYGGSSLLSNFIMLGFITSVRNFSKKTDVFQIR